MVGQEPAAADPEFRIAGLGGNALNQFCARPDTAGILPAPAATGEPFPQNRAGGNESAFGFNQRAGQGFGLAGGPHAGGDERSQQIGRDREPRTLGDIVDAADDFKTEPRAHRSREQARQGFARAFDPRGDDARGNNRGFEQAEIIAGKIKHFIQVSDVGGRAEVNTGESQHGLVNDTQIGLDRRPRGGIPTVDREVDGNVEDPGTFGKVHAQKENIAPARMRKVHANRGGFAQDWKSFVGPTLE